MLSSITMHQPGDDIEFYHQVQVNYVWLFYSPQHRYLINEQVPVFQQLRLQLLHKPKQLTIRSQMQPDLLPVRGRWLLQRFLQILEV